MIQICNGFGSFCSRWGGCSLHTIVKGNVGKEQEIILNHHCFAWKSLHGIGIQSSVWRVNFFFPQYPKISSSLSMELPWYPLSHSFKTEADHGKLTQLLYISPSGVSFFLLDSGSIVHTYLSFSLIIINWQT